MEQQKFIEWKEKIIALQMENQVTIPDGGGDIEQLRNLCVAFADDLRGSIDFAGFFPDPIILEGVVAWANAPVFLCGVQGKELAWLQQRLSEHKQLVTIPGDSKYWALRKVWKGACFIDIAREWIFRMVCIPGFIPPLSLADEVRLYNDFLQYLNFFSHSSTQDSFVCGVLAYYASRHEYYEDVKRWVEKSPDNDKVIYSMLEQFPEAKFIHLTRASTPSSIYLARSNQEQLGSERYRIIAYEDFLDNEENTFNGIFDFLKIRTEHHLKMKISE